MTYADAVTLSYKTNQMQNINGGIQKELEAAFEPDDLGIVLNHLNNQYLFVSWLDATGYCHQYPELTEYLDSKGYRARANEAMESSASFKEQVDHVVNWS
jgi:hypothetical protein